MSNKIEFNSLVSSATNLWSLGDTEFLEVVSITYFKDTVRSLSLFRTILIIFKIMKNI